MNYLQKILFADDNPLDVELTLEALKEFNLDSRVDVVLDGIEALEYLKCQGKYSNRRSELPVVLLLDINMPRMDGLEVLRIIRNDDELKHLPVVILTASKEDEARIECFELGINAYVTKPIKLKEFIDILYHIGNFWANSDVSSSKENEN